MTKTRQEVTLEGEEVTLVGSQPELGQPAPDFMAVDQNLDTVPFSSLGDKIFVLSSVVSLDNTICDAETKKFNEEATEFGEDVEVITISMDLPFAQERWCGAEGVERVTTLSDYRDASFGLAYGVLMKDLRLLARAIFVVDRDRNLRYKQIVPEVTDEPDYEPVLDCLRTLTQE
ncbi:MAG: thiol peroxidase [Planctomycetota bacterium]